MLERTSERTSERTGERMNEQIQRMNEKRTTTTTTNKQPVPQEQQQQRQRQQRDKQRSLFWHSNFRVLIGGGATIRSSVGGAHLAYSVCVSLLFVGWLLFCSFVRSFARSLALLFVALCVCVSV